MNRWKQSCARSSTVFISSRDFFVAPLPRDLRNRAGTSWKRFRLRYLARHSERQRLLWEEMEFHIESMAQDLVGRGMSEQEARAAAHRKFGNMTQNSEQARSVWIVDPWWHCERVKRKRMQQRAD